LPFQVRANIDDHTLAVNCETAEDAFAKAVEWQVTRLGDVSISDGTKFYAVSEFAAYMASLKADTVETSAEKAKPQG
jgi:hypothetical protein